MNIINNNNKKIVQTLDNMYETKAIIIATGIDSRELNIPGEKELLGRGVSYCATCDGNFFKNKIVAIVGGGEKSIEDALYLQELCNKLYFITNKKMDLSLLNKSNIEILEKTKIIKINGENKLTSITINSNNIESTINIDGLFIAIANIPETAYLLNGLNSTPTGNIISKEDMSTNIEGIFVAGDLRNKELKQLVTATSDGAIAATNAIKYINCI